jgi:hypothetical protein
LAHEIAADPQVALDYADWKRSQDKPKGDVSADSQVYAIQSQILTNRALLEGSDLPPEKVAELDAKNFVQFGAEGVVEWNKAITKALVEHEAAKKLDGQLDETLEAQKQERLAEADRQRPGGLATPGRKVPALTPVGRPSTSRDWAEAFVR